jgi:hypothetical protein
MRQIEFIVPEIFDASKIIPAGYRSDKRQNLTNAMHYVLHLLRPNVYNEKWRKYQEKYGYLPLNAVLLNKIIGKDYKEVLELLQQQDVITSNGSYSTGNISTCYRLSPLYLGKTKCITPTKGGLVKRLKEHYSQQEQEQSSRLKSVQHLLPWLSAKHIKIDEDGCHDYIESYSHKMRVRLDETKFTRYKKRAEAKYRIFLKTDTQRTIVRAIDGAKFNNHRDDAGRLYTLISSMKSELRSFITLDGEQLCTVDIKSSQPYLFQYILQPDFWKTTNKLPITLYKNNRNTYNILKESGILKHIIMFVSSPETIASIKLQKYSLKNINWQSDYYTYLQEIVLKSDAPHKVKEMFASRGKVKKMMMMLLYMDFSQQELPAYNLFEQLFPVETRLMDIIKQAGKEVFPNILVNIEATLVLETITKQLSLSNPDMPLITIHDGIACKPCDGETVRQVMHDVLTKVIGVEPGLKVEELSKQQVMNDINSTVVEELNEIHKNVNRTREDNCIHALLNIREEPLLHRFPFVDGRPLYSTRYVAPELYA